MRRMTLWGGREGRGDMGQKGRTSSSVRHGGRATDAVRTDRASEGCRRMLYRGRRPWPDWTEREVGSTPYHPMPSKQGRVFL